MIISLNLLRIDAYTPILPFFNRIEREKQDEFLDEYVKLSMEFEPDPEVDVVEKFQPSQSVNIFVSYKLLLVYARK